MAILPEKGWSRDKKVTWQSRVNREPFKTLKKKKKIYKGPAPTVYYCEWNKWHSKILLLFLLLPHWKWFRCYGLFFQKIVINLLKWVLKLMAAWYLVFSVFLVGVKSSTWLCNEKWRVCMKVGSLLYENTCSEWLHVVYSKFDRL